MAGRSVVYCLPNENRRFSQREAEALELNLTQKQVQTLSPQMMQSMEILQMGSQELLEYIEEAVQENPVLEPEETYDKQDEFSVLRRKLEWLESTDPQNRYYHQQDTEEEDSPLNNFGTVQDDDENLYYYVLSQLRVLELEPEVMDAGVFLVESLNQNGWLDEPLEALAAGHGCGPEVMGPGPGGGTVPGARRRGGPGSGRVPQAPARAPHAGERAGGTYCGAPPGRPVQEPLRPHCPGTESQS